jgi:hypothetical protein
VGDREPVAHAGAGRSDVPERTYTYAGLSFSSTWLKPGAVAQVRGQGTRAHGSERSDNEPGLIAGVRGVVSTGKAFLDLTLTIILFGGPLQDVGNAGGAWRGRPCNLILVIRAERTRVSIIGLA